MATAKQHGIDVLLDAVLNVCKPQLRESVVSVLTLLQHKLGADGTEVFNVVPSNDQNRTQDAGPAREIEVGCVSAQAPL